MVIPALHDAASDQPIPYTPVCRRSTVVVCLHPAFRAFLGDEAAALDPVLGEVAGLPGAPVRAEQISTDALIASNGAVMSATPPVFHFPVPITPGSFGVSSREFHATMANLFLTTFIAGSGALAGRTGDPAQQAIETALLAAAGVRAAGPMGHAPGSPGRPPPGSAAARQLARVLAAASRFGALPDAARHAWLKAHLAALRAGRITLGQLP